LVGLLSSAPGGKYRYSGLTIP